LHNNYLTLPVIFFMLSSHYPLAFATQWNWLIASLIFLVGVVIRHYFNTRHARKGNPHWTWLAAVVLFLLIAWLSSGPKIPGSAGDLVASRAAEPFMAAAHFKQASLTVQTRCAMCHTAEPAWDGIYEAPKNVILDNDIAIANHAKDIAIQAGYAHAMPPGNVSEITPEERALLVEWYREGSAL
ncbi:MAG: urate hydroxylase PuuD, partial [Devosia sp.]